ncbi:hypothetical protein GLOIN_2v1770668 [Rhizophagus clarus]|uniref:Uncharacterized protein n=1 Tax=Rhizophagus clarus TaxID=94130 RepID=A0A8H3QHZ6_9GLOM|nr:hypothetical protein GLOIN_2v1770668 [Rhizophagus clarus]
MSPDDTSNILSLLKSLQQDMTEVRNRITALELNDRCMTRIEQHLGLLPQPDNLATTQSLDMLIDAPVIPNPTVTLVSSRPAVPPVQTSPLNLLSPDFAPSRPVRAPLSAPIDISATSSLSSTSHAIPSPTQTRDEIQAINPAHARQLKRRSHRIFSFDSVTPSQWDDFAVHIDTLCNISPTLFASWHINRMCEYLHANIIAGANAILPAHTVEKEFQDSSIKAHLESRDQNFDTDISSFINSALSRSRRRITLDRVFIDHPSAPQLLTDPKDISDAAVNHFQTVVPIRATPPPNILALPDRWRSAYSPMNTISSDIYSSHLAPPSLEEWLSTVSSMPNGKAPGPSMITHFGHSSRP